MTSKVSYSKTNSWNSGLQAEITLSAEEALNGWTIEFDASYPISQIWNARIISHIGNHYVIANADWNAAVAKGGTVSFGFIAGLGDAPTGYLVNGQPLSTAPVPPPSPVLPSISVADIAVAEGNAGQGAATFTVRLSAPSTTAVSLAYATAPGSAAAGTDFEARSGTLIFAPGETTKTVTVVVKGDAAVEANETFSLVLSGAVGATLVGTGATATIVNDDATIVTPPAATVTDAAVTEDARGSVQAIFTVSLTRPADGPVSLRYATRDGTAIAGADYVAASGTIAFAAGETSKTIAVAVQDDQAVEGDEAFALVLSDAAGASIGRGTGTATIRDNDAPPPPTPPATGAVSYAVASDWGNGFTAEVQVTASASRLDGWTVAFDAGFSITNLWNAEIVSHVGTHYVIRNAAWNGAVAPSGTVSFGFQASTSSGHDVSQLVLAAAGGTGGALPALSIADATVTEGNAGSASESFTVSLSHAATTAVTVGFATASGSAVAGADFVAATGTITFNPGEVSKVLTVAVLGDTVQEATETYGITLSAASGATIADGAAVGTILDNDAVTGQPPPATAGFFHTEGNQIVDASGHPVEIAGVNWFGFETATAAPHGLFARSYTAMMDQMKALGFNTIRLPFSDQLLDPSRNAPGGIDYTLNPDLRGLSGLALMDKIVAYAGTIGLKIILDHHRSSAGDGANGGGLWYDQNYGEAKWIENWQMLATHYAGNATVIGADLANEPHGAATWGDGSANDWAAAATRAGNAIQSVNANWLIVVEGTGQGYWWGGDLSGVATRPITLNVANHVVYSPHDYPNSIYGQPWFSEAGFPGNLEQVFDQHWGFIYRQDIAPVLLGEFGSKLADPKDLAWLDRIIRYLDGDFNADGRPDIPAGDKGISWAWWSWNPNSGDTGGILGDDWTTVDQVKIAALRPLLADASPLSGGL